MRLFVLRTPAPARVKPDIWTSYAVSLFRSSSSKLFNAGSTVISATNERQFSAHYICNFSTDKMDNTYSSLSRRGTRSSGSCNRAGNLWRRPLGWTTTAAPPKSASRCSCWCSWERRRELREEKYQDVRLFLFCHAQDEKKLAVLAH